MTINRASVIKREKMNKFLYIFIIISLIFNIVYAQKKAVAPPTPIDLPSDTAKAVTRQTTRVDIKNSQLNLPDVLILGKDKTKREITNKHDFFKDSPTLIKPEMTNNPVSIWFSRESAKPEIEKKSEINNRLNWGQFFGGGYTTLTADAGHWQKLAKGDISMHGWLDRSSGQFKNSQYLTGGISGKGNIILAPNVTGSVRAEYDLNNKGLYNALNKDNLKRKINSIIFGSELIYDFAGLSDGVLGFEINNTNLQSDTTLQYEKRENFWYNIYFNYTKYFSFLQLTASGRYIRETSSFESDSANTKDSFGEAGLEALSQISSKMIFAVGANYQMTKTDSLSNESKISPYAKINFMPDRRLGLSLKYQSGMKYNTFSEWLGKNPFLDHSTPPVIEKEKHAVLFDIDYEPVSKFKLHAGISHRIMESLPYWESEQTTQLVQLKSMQNPELTEMNFGFHAKINDQTQIQVYYIHHLDKIDKNTTLSSTDKIPYRPEYRIPVNATFKLLKGTFLMINADIYGPRASTPDSGDDLASFTLVNAGIKQNFGKFNAHISVRNLFDSEYVMWKYFPETGIYILGGISAKF